MHSGESIDSPESFDPFTRLNRLNDPRGGISLSSFYFVFSFSKLLPFYHKYHKVLYLKVFVCGGRMVKVW